MKQIQGSVRVKIIKEYVNACIWSEFKFFSFHFLSFSVSLPKLLNHFYYFTSLHGLEDVENQCAHLRDIELETFKKNP